MTPVLIDENATAGWFRMTRNALGLSVEDLAFILDVHRETIRKGWERGTSRIPEGVTRELNRFVDLTNVTVDVLIDRADRFLEPAIVTFADPRDIPEGHIAAAYGCTWWDHVAFSVSRKAHNVFVGTEAEVRDVYDVNSELHDVYAEPWCLTIEAEGDKAKERVRQRHAAARSEAVREHMRSRHGHYGHDTSTTP